MRTSFGPLLTVSDHHCPCGRPVDEDGACYRCDAPEPEISDDEPEDTEDECGCGLIAIDRATGYVDTCPLHPAAVPVPDALARLKSLMCLCSSSDLDANATACRVHGKAG